MMTVHSAKGLEFKNVFVVGLEENLFPSNNFGNNMSLEAYEEERRLFYVALTRAEENAYISYAKQRYRWGKLDFCNPSRFIEDLDEQYLELPEEKDTFSFDEPVSSKKERPSNGLNKLGGQPRRMTVSDQPGLNRN